MSFDLKDKFLTPLKSAFSTFFKDIGRTADAVGKWFQDNIGRQLTNIYKEIQRLPNPSQFVTSYLTNGLNNLINS